MIQISPRIIIDERLISEEFVRASGPGGQHVNKVSSAVQLKFDIANWKPDDPELKVRLLKIAGNRVIYNRETGTAQFVMIEARRFRSQEKNRTDALNRLRTMILKASEKPKKRIDTKPSLASVKKRLLDKKKRKMRKELRKKVSTNSGE